MYRLINNCNHRRSVNFRLKQNILKQLGLTPKNHIVYIIDELYMFFKVQRNREKKENIEQLIKKTKKAND